MSYYCFSRMPGERFSIAEGFVVVLLTASSVVCLYNSLRFEMWSYCNKAIQIQNNWGYFKPCID